MQDLSKEVAFSPLAIIGTRGTEEMCRRIEKYIGEWRKEEPHYIIEAVSAFRNGRSQMPSQGICARQGCLYCGGLLQLQPNL